MRVAILVNHPFELKSSMSTALFAWRLAGRGHAALLVPVHGLSWGAHAPSVRGFVLTASAAPEQALAQMRDSPAVVRELRPGDVLLLRTNPARDPARAEIHRAALKLARLAAQHGVIVLNHPDAIERVGNKLYLLELPASSRPRQVISAEVEELVAFAESESGPVVLKPLWGTRGDGVVKVDVAVSGMPALLAAAEELLASGPVVAQEYLNEAPEGDTRLLVLDGEVIEVGGRRAVVRRVPVPGEFRSNVHLGGTAHPGLWTPQLAALCSLIRPCLQEAGVFLAGVDVVGNKVVEVNAYAPGGFANAEEFEGADFIGAVLDAVEERVARSG